MFERIQNFAKFIQLSHTVFSVPFALIIFFLSDVTLGFDNVLKLLATLLLLTCLRASGMSFNRIIDVEIDRDNPRTKHRELISGKLTKNQAWVFLTTVTFLYLVIAVAISLPMWFTIIYLGIIWGYSISKRFTWLCHYWIGLSLAGAPIGMWLIFGTNSISIDVILFALGVFFWVAGFDIIYSLADYQFDQTHHIKSIPVRFGIKRALLISRITHAFTILSLILFGILEHTFLLYFVGVLVFMIGLIYEQSLISENNISRVNKAFFTVNGYISIGFMLIVSLHTFLMI